MSMTEIGPLGEFDLIDDIARAELVTELDLYAEERRQARLAKKALEQSVDQGEES